MEDAIRSKVCWEPFASASRLQDAIHLEFDHGIIGLTIIFRQVNEALKPSSLEIFNDSHKHAHHQAMKDSTSKETHFR